MLDLINSDCVKALSEMKADSVDLTVTSPPYDNLRSYNGNNETWCEYVWKQVIEQLYRVTKEGGLVVWIVADATIKGSETGTSFKQALYAMDCGFRLHDTMIWDKGINSSIGSNNRYKNSFEYMFIWSKGKPKTANIIADRKNKRAGELQHGSIRQKDGSVRKTSGYGKRRVREYGERMNVWQVVPAKSKRERLHPAPFSEALAHDHIISWTNPYDTVLDPFMGSGTTGAVCAKTNRNFIGIELDRDYYDIAVNRINEAKETASE